MYSVPELATRGDQTLSYGYDALSRERSEAGAYGTFSFDYDREDRLTSIAWPDGFYALYPRDAVGEVTQIEENGATRGPGLLASYSYDDLGRRVGMSRGDGVSTTWNYDRVDDLTSIVHSFPVGQSEVIRLGYDVVGEIITRTSSNPAYDGPAAPSGSTGYGINGLNQLTKAGALGLSYDGRGNLASDGVNGYRYDSDNHLISFNTSATMRVDPVDRLMEVTDLAGGVATSASRWFRYREGALLAEYGMTSADDGVLYARHVPGPGWTRRWSPTPAAGPPRAAGC